MKYINYLFVLLSLSVYSVVNGQSNEVKKKYSDAEFHVASNNYALALPLYLEVFTSDPSNANLNYKIGICYLKSVSEKNKAVPFLELAVTKMSKGYDDIDLDEKDAPYSALYHLGRAYHFDYKFDEAISFLEKYKVLFKSGRDKEIIKELDLEIQQCVFGKETVKKPNDVTVANLGDSINSKYPDFAPIISADESMIIFTSRREGSTGSDWMELILKIYMLPIITMEYGAKRYKLAQTSILLKTMLLSVYLQMGSNCLFTKTTMGMEIFTKVI